MNNQSNKDEKTLIIDYDIVNREVNFNENACQRVDERKGNITTVNKSIADAIKEPFDGLRESMQTVKSSDLESEITRVGQEKLRKKDELRKIKIKTNGGYIAMSTLLIVGTIALAAVIFTIIGNLLNRS